MHVGIAIPTRVEDVLKDYKPLLGKCVRVTGFVARRGLYDSIQSFYLRDKGILALPEPGDIALYGSRSVSQDWFWSYRAGAELVGTVSACNLIDTTPTAPNQIVMVIGECHYRDGPLIYTTEVHPDPHVESRLYGPEAYAKYHTLEPVDDDQINPSKRMLIREWFDAVRAQDTQKMKALLQWKFSSRDGDLKDATNPARSPYWFLIGAKNRPKIQYFLTTEPARNERSTEGCVCKISDCKNFWPINSDDARPREIWPYVCVEIYRVGDIAF